MRTIDEMIADKTSELKREITQVEDLAPKFKRLDALMKNIGPFVKYRRLILPNMMSVCVDVKRISDIEPVVEYLQDQMGIEFDETRDVARMGWRVYSCKAEPWFRLDAELADDGPDCRRVVVGYETVPKYEIKCGDDAAMPDAAPPTV
jgi:hypothetical protein